jgi:hypothetical protein
MPAALTTAADHLNRSPYGGQEVSNFRKEAPGPRFLGKVRRRGFSNVFGSQRRHESLEQYDGTLEMRALTSKPAAESHQAVARRRLGRFCEWRSQDCVRGARRMYDFIQEQGITGFATIAGYRAHFRTNHGRSESLPE